MIPYHIVDYYINTTDDMENEMDFFGRCNVFEYIHDLVIFSMTHWNMMF